MSVVSILLTKPNYTTDFKYSQMDYSGYDSNSTNQSHKTCGRHGRNSGIGLATAQRLVDEGAYVFITGRRQSTAVKLIGKNVTGAVCTTRRSSRKAELIYCLQTQALVNSPL